MARQVKTTALQDQLAQRLASTEFAPGQTFAGRWWGRSEEAERFYFADSAQIFKNGRPIRGTRVWLQFDDPGRLEGMSLHAVAKKEWHRQILAELHVRAYIAALDLVDPAAAARLTEEVAAAKTAGRPIADLGAAED